VRGPGKKNPEGKLGVGTFIQIGEFAIKEEETMGA
jgi:hypothetical protein